MATSSLPVPDSPKTSTVALVVATCSTLLEHPSHGRRLTDDARHGEALAQFLPQIAIFAHETLPAQGTPHEQLQAVQIDGLGDVVVGPAPHGLHGHLDGAMTGDQNHGGVGVVFLDVAQQVEPTDPAHHHVGDDHVGGRQAQPVDGLLTARGSDHLQVALFLPWPVPKPHDCCGHPRRQEPWPA